MVIMSNDLPVIRPIIHHILFKFSGNQSCVYNDTLIHSNSVRIMACYKNVLISLKRSMAISFEFLKNTYC